MKNVFLCPLIHLLNNVIVCTQLMPILKLIFIEKRTRNFASLFVNIFSCNLVIFIIPIFALWIVSINYLWHYILCLDTSIFCLPLWVFLPPLYNPGWCFCYFHHRSPQSHQTSCSWCPCWWSQLWTYKCAHPEDISQISWDTEMLLGQTGCKIRPFHR